MGSPRQVGLRLMSIALVAASTLPVFLVGSSFFRIGPELGIGVTLVAGCLFVAAWLAGPVVTPRRVSARAV